MHANQILRNLYTNCSLKQQVRAFYFIHCNLAKPSLLKVTLLKLISFQWSSVVTSTRISRIRVKFIWIFLCYNEGIKYAVNTMLLFHVITFTANIICVPGHRVRVLWFYTIHDRRLWQGRHTSDRRRGIKTTFRKSLSFCNTETMEAHNWFIQSDRLHRPILVTTSNTIHGAYSLNYEAVTD